MEDEKVVVVVVVVSMVVVDWTVSWCLGDESSIYTAIVVVVVVEVVEVLWMPAVFVRSRSWSLRKHNYSRQSFSK